MAFAGLPPEGYGGSNAELLDQLNVLRQQVGDLVGRVSELEERVAELEAEQS